MTTPETALVLGPGGLPGTAWTAGLLAGLRDLGTDLTTADLIVGTSAGAIVGAAVACGGDPAAFAARGPKPGARRPDPSWLRRVGEILSGPGTDRLKRAGELADEAVRAGAVEPEEAVIERMAKLLDAVAGTTAWPRRRLLIPAVDVETGVPRVFDSTDETTRAVPLPAVIAASTAMPGMAPPITIEGRRYMDGALRAGVNADLGDEARTKTVIAPFTGPADPSWLTPDDPAPFADPGDPAAWTAAYEAGRAQAATAGAKAPMRPRRELR
ncbi:patatin-like phospholipase family protein [Actinomadura atramentaria]|uniref:patatin-like phospholipase family protein n=1 Tax=Actinomadura atramentaria TaxID=1990 RepID=UPI00035FFB86|nr:patatin-like phospholipase family protein [Actinomadura atramentaria]